MGTRKLYAIKIVGYNDDDTLKGMDEYGGIIKIPNQNHRLNNWYWYPCGKGTKLRVMNGHRQIETERYYELLAFRSK